MEVKLHWAERFINWYPHNTKLYIRGEKGADWEKARALNKELFDALVPFLDKLRAEAFEEGRRSVSTPSIQDDPPKVLRR